MSKKSTIINSDLRYKNILDNISLGSRYVFFESLKNHPGINRKIYDQASAELGKINSNFRDTLNNSSSTRMAASLKFLMSSASYERSKEVNFFQKFLQMYPEVNKNFDLQISKDMDYVEFIAKINSIIKGVNNFKNELNTEINRINKRNQKSVQNKNSKQLKTQIKQDEEEYKKDLLNNNQISNASTFFLKLDGQKTFDSIIHDQGIQSDITNLIIENYGGNILIQAGDHLKIDSLTFSPLIKILSDMAYKLLITKYSTQENIKKNNRIEETITSNEFKEIVQNLLEAPNLSEALLSIASQHNISEATIKKLQATEDDIQTLTNKLRYSYEKLEHPTISFDKYLEQYNTQINIEDIVRSILTVRAQGYYTGEDLSLTELLTAHIGGILGGKSNPTDDIQAGKLIINYDITTDKSGINSIIREQEKQLLNVQNEYFKKIKRTTTLNSFTENTEQLRKARTQQQEILNQLKSDLKNSSEGLEYLVQHINFHTTIKGYESAGSASFKRYGGFEGASFGSNLNNQLQILSEATNQIAESGGISQEDIGWLHFAMINAGDQMIGRSNKKSLEDYFSIFVGFFMFNDAQMAVEDAFNYINDKIENDDVQDIHLYQLNGVFIPSSYLLQKTFESLLPILDNVENKAESGQGVQAILHTYNGGPLKGYYGQNWAATEAAAEAATYLEMKFLSGFLDLLNSIQEKMANL